ncbi:cobalamin B12-binding domain-containing protein [Alkalihalobacterium alkalinitrilicum]|uniref:cobalamin B12-binding domain-containing protein n=1 Tax=Alkalihalobacterium alkalinitrilicum TaxID=427920 RepID=UPI0009952DF0|nr:cobalamin-dependent protein [Alkalihalobacterium alkalinitrilicum]
MGQGRITENFSTEYLSYLLESNRTEARRLILDQFKHNIPIEHTYFGIEKTMYKIGQMWQRNEITVANEHLASAIVHQNVMECYQYVINQKPKKGRVITCTTQEELHDLGIKLVNHILEYQGYDVIYLGNKLPIKDAIPFFKKENPDYIAISVTIYTHVHHAKELIDKIKNEPQLKDSKIIIGGYCFKQNPSLLKLLNYDCYIEDITDLVTKI